MIRRRDPIVSTLQNSTFFQPTQMEIHKLSNQRLLSVHTKYSVFFFMCTKVFVHLTHLKLPQISQTYLKFIVWSENFIKIHLECYEKYFLGIFHHFTKSGIFHNLSINVLSKNDLLNVHMLLMKTMPFFR